MTEGFQTVLAASERECRDLFLAAANRLGTAPPSDVPTLAKEHSEVPSQYFVALAQNLV
jgi:hypothetical protein